MRLIPLWLRRLFFRPPRLDTMIDGKLEVVTEMARAQAAANMRLRPDVKERVVKLLQDRYGEKEGLKEAKRRYPEGWW